MLYVSKSEIWSKIQIFVRFLGLKTLVPANFTSAEKKYREKIREILFTFKLHNTELLSF